MTGFAFVAYPAQYRSSGVMTFVVSTDAPARRAAYDGACCGQASRISNH